MTPSGGTPGTQRDHGTKANSLKVGVERSQPYKITSYGTTPNSSQHSRTTAHVDVDGSTEGAICHQMKPVAFVDLTRTDDNNGMQEAASNTLELSSIANSRSDSSSAHVKNEGDSKLAPSPNRHVRRRDIYKLKDANNPITHSKAYEKTRE